MKPIRIIERIAYGDGTPDELADEVPTWGVDPVQRVEGIRVGGLTDPPGAPDGAAAAADDTPGAETMTGIRWEHLHPLTQSLLREKLVHSRNQRHLDCGCSKTTSGSWQLCAFHEGFDEGAVAASQT